jgi:prepilin-type N-terminal cleavage/methylation domain-containing protein
LVNLLWLDKIFACGGKLPVLLFPTMNRRAFSLIELLIVVAIIAVLVGVAMPYYQDYVKETRLTKAKHELDIFKEALIKFDTMEERPFDRDDLRILLGKYLQEVPRDPWGRDYQIDYVSGKIWSYGPDYQKETDDLVVYYKPPLALQKAIWVDADKDRHISSDDFIKLSFSRILKTDLIPTLTYSTSSDSMDLWFSPDVAIGVLGIASHTASTTEILIPLDGGVLASDTAFYPGSSTVGISATNTKIEDFSGRKANGTTGEYPGIEVTIKAD